MSESSGPANELISNTKEDLTEVHSFYLYLLELSIGREIPVPLQISHDTDSLLNFVLLLDMAVTAPMIRNGLKVQEHRNTSGALLRFYAIKPQRRREDRDKVDVIASTLFRTLFTDPDSASVDTHERSTRDFQTLLERMYGAIPHPEPPSEHMQLVRRFEILRREVLTFQTFDELIDSNVMQRVRAIKQTLHPSFLHPAVLSVIAHYNVCFHSIFDRLFAQAASNMRSFAAKLRRDGGTMVGDDEDLFARLKKGELLDEEALRKTPLRQFATVRRTIENDRHAQRNPADAALAVALSGATDSTGSEPNGYNEPTSTLTAAESEQKELAAVQVTIRSFVRAADTQAAQVVPLPSGNIELSAAEVDAFRSDFGPERSFRADCAAALVNMACLDARLRAQLQEFEKTRHTVYNWKPHADALAHLLSIGRNIANSSMDLAVFAEKRGLDDKARSLHESIDKLRPNGRAAVEALQSITTGESQSPAAESELQV